MKKRIGILVPEFRTEAAPGGGVSTVADFVFSAFNGESDWDVELISPRMWSRAPESQRIRDPKSWLRGPQPELRTVEGKRVTYVGSYFAEIEALRYLPRRALRQTLSTFDAVVVVCGTPAIITSVRGLKIPVLAQVATTVQVERKRLVLTGSILRRAYARLNRALTYQLDKTGIRIPEKVLVENPWMENWTASHGARNVALEIPGIDTDFFTPSDAEPATPRQSYIVSVGRLNDPRKDFGLLVRAYSRAVEKHGITQQLVIAGREDLLPEVYSEIDKRAIAEKVKIKKNISQEELRDLYRGADLFAMSSSEEGLGLVLIESMACGTPIVSTATEGAKSVARTAGIGELVEFGDEVERDLANAIAKLALDTSSQKKQSELSRRAAVEAFSMTSAGDRFKQQLESILTV